MLLVKERTYTIAEFLNHLNSKDVDLKNVDKEVGYYLRQPQLRSMIITTTACLQHTVIALASVADAKAKMRSIGMEIFGLCQETAFWIALIMCAIEIIRALVSGDKKSVTGIVAKYLIGFGALFFLPWLFELIRDIFSTGF